MLVVQSDLLAPTINPTRPPLSDEELNGFDLVAFCKALHHVEDIYLATKHLAEKLQPGAVFLTIDWVTWDASSNETEQQARVQMENHHHHHHDVHETIDSKLSAAHTISHDSFSRDQVFSLFEQAGCGKSQFVLEDRLSPVPGGVGRCSCSGLAQRNCDIKIIEHRLDQQSWN